MSKENYMNRNLVQIPARTCVSALALVLAVTSLPARAQDTGWYGGFGVGRARADMDSDPLVAGLRSAGFSTTAIDMEGDDTGWKVLGGYSFTPRIALEGSYIDLGDFDFNASLNPSAVQSGAASMRGFGLDLVATLPFRGNMSVFGKVGINNLRIEQSFGTAMPAGGFVNNTDRGTKGKFGGGLQYRVSDALSLRAEVERFLIEDNRVTEDRVDLASVGFLYRFGARPAPVAATPAPAPAAAPPAPAPAPAPILEVTLDASALFDFDRSELKPEGRQELDELVRDINGLTYDAISIVGHTDRIGTREYNLALSSRRAETVRAYLVQAGLPATRITARGINSDEPVTAPDQCRGMPAAQVIACLAPDRRVVVIVTGTRPGE